jgi:hypothetical protein
MIGNTIKPNKKNLESFRQADNIIKEEIPSMTLSDEE